ncbi:MAG TPA: hypothetical protein VIC61_10510, partial [Gammaproteobacteria bacterium]
MALSEAELLIREIESFCRRAGLAESTFGRLAVGNSKLMTRLRAGRGVTLTTLQRLRDYMRRHEQPAGPSPIVRFDPGEGATDPPETDVRYERPFRFYDNRQKYLAFVHTCDEKIRVAERAIHELQHVEPAPPGLRLFDAGTGEGLVLTEVLRNAHHRHPTVPLFVNGKEISDENARLCLQKMPDRFCEHPATVLAISNMRFADAAALVPGDQRAAVATHRIEVALRGTSSHDFAVQIAGLEQTLKEGWATRRSAATGNPLPIRSSLL